MAGGSSYKKIYSGEVTVSTTDTSPQLVETIALGAVGYTSDKLVYVKIRDKAGSRDGYFYGTDGFVYNPYPAISATTNATVIGGALFRKNSSSQIEAAANGFGVFAALIDMNGNLRINSRYSATGSLTIDGTFSVDVYLLDWPDDVSPFI